MPCGKPNISRQLKPQSNLRLLYTPELQKSFLCPLENKFKKMAPLSWRHHTLIQALLSRGPLKENDFRSIFSQITGRTLGSRQQEPQLFSEYIGNINSELSYVQLELRACINQYDGHVYYGIVNNVSDDQSKLGTKYSVPQIAFYRGIVEAIIQDAEAGGCIFNTVALNIKLELQAPDSQSQGGAIQTPPAFRNFSMLQKEQTIDQLMKDQWLCSIAEGKIGIGVRSFLDLRSWFRSNEVPACEVCNEAAIKAQLCQNEACNVRLHQYCLKKKFSGKRVERVCPGCGTQWHGSMVKAEMVEDIISDDPEDSQPHQRSMKRKHKANGDSAGYGYTQTLATALKNERVSREEDSQTCANTRRVTRRSARLSAN